MDTPTYQAGDTVAYPFILTVKLDKNVPVTRHVLIARWIEFWCQNHCTEGWHLSEDHSHIEVSFESEYDAVIFKLSPEYSLT